MNSATKRAKPYNMTVVVEACDAYRAGEAMAKARLRMIDDPMTTSMGVCFPIKGFTSVVRDALEAAQIHIVEIY